MLMRRQTNPDGSIFYPESDGQPMSDNTRQFRWIYIFAGNLAILFDDREDVFVCGNQNWYPIEGEPEICQAPDAYVVFGRPKGDRPSYKQWEEGGIPMTVVFEVLSPKNTVAEMNDKLLWYEEYGVEEYYVYDPDNNKLYGYTRRGDMLIQVRRMDGFVSPRLGIRFDLSGPELVVRYPDGRPFLTMQELDRERQKAEKRADQAKQETDRATQEADQARQEADQARQEADQARQEADQARQRATDAEQRALRLAELSRKVLHQQASPEDVQELERLLQAPPPDAS
jgi:Uma2 family endonuclease